MSKAAQKPVVDVEEVDEDIPLHDTINEEEARTYRESLDKIFDDMATNIEDRITNAMELAIMELKNRNNKTDPWHGRS